MEIPATDARLKMNFLNMATVSSLASLHRKLFLDLQRRACMLVLGKCADNLPTSGIPRSSRSHLVTTIIPAQFLLP